MPSSRPATATCTSPTEELRLRTTPTITPFNMYMSQMHPRSSSMTSGAQKLMQGQMPECWRVDYNIRKGPLFIWFWKLEALWFQFLCLIAFGKAGLEVVWLDACDEHHFKETTEQIKHQVNNTNIMAGLLLATAAVFLTTDTPRKDMLSFDDSAPYALLLFAFGMAMGSILGGCALQLVAGRCTPAFLIELTSTRIRLLFTLLLIGYPLFSVALACNICGVGLLIASLSSPYAYVIAGAIFLVALPWALFFIFAWLAITPAKDRIRRPTLQTAASDDTMTDLESGLAGKEASADNGL
ncbi:hypothetical protein BDN72DRAFT_893870 [Pluteus cervinus]|uniref:Uncharacterized protein n=1 Tax=Pluteus cervinus TaxID=181527 RepID=A0ACD3B6K5_9AGAR|nr:hypothetical protein BDN72DRAFT_893870 [Pluteus cervinus]